MQYTVNHGEKGKIEVKVDVPKSSFDEAYSQVLGQLGKDAQIDGFRPGKAPADIVEQHVGYNKILNETASFLISKHVADIFKKEELVPLDSPKIAVQSLTKGAPFSFTVSFTQKPKVKIGDWKKIKVERVKARQITEKDVEESIKNIFEAWQKQRETRNNKQETDGGTITEGTKKTEGTEGKGKFIYDAQGNKVFFEDKSIPSTSEESKPFGFAQGEPTSEVKQVPDDDFAKAIGVRDLVHLKELVKKDLEAIVVDQVEAKLEQEIFEKILEVCDLEVGDILVEDELNRMLVRLTSALEQQGKTLDSYLAEQKSTIEALKAKWRAQAEKNVQISLSLDQIGKDEKVQVAREELEQALKGVNQTNLSDREKKDLENYVVFSIFQAKTLDLVKKIVTS